MKRISQFHFNEGRVIADKYVVEERLGGGWEGEVYRVRERHTGIQRALKLFFPHRNPRNRTLRRHAKKLDKLRRCEFVIQYHSTETVPFEGHDVACLVSELVEGHLLSDFVANQPARRLSPFEGLHLTYALARGLEEIHLAKEYHGDIHDGNVMVTREGVFFRPRLVDFFNRGPLSRQRLQDDVVDIVRLLYDMVGGAKHYRSQPAPVKAICRGLRNDLVRRAFPTASHLRRHLESFSW